MLIVRCRIGALASCRATFRSSERSEPSREFSGDQIAMNASASSQSRCCSGAATRSTSSGASRANGPPISSKLICSSGYARRRAICSMTASISGRASGVARTWTCQPGCTPTDRSTSKRAYSSSRGSRTRPSCNAPLSRRQPPFECLPYSSVRRNSSISSAGSVSIFVEPRAPRATEILATVAMSGASTTFTKSNSPRVAHWCSTRQPSSSTSLLPSRSRSGFDLSVVTPCCVSVDRRMKMGIAASPSVGCGGAYPGCLVEIQQRAADEEEWTEDEVGRGEGDPLAVVSLRVQERAERVPGDADNDDERRERAERVHVVGDAELAAAGEGVAERAPLDHRRRDGEADEREPRDPR